MDAPADPPSLKVLRIDGRIGRVDVAPLCDRVRELVADGDTELVIFDVRGLVAPDAIAVDAVARMQLTARRLGCGFRLRHVCPLLNELLVLSGLAGVVLAYPS